MDNLTLKDRVVKPGVTPAPLVGYKVCVFEDTRGGTKFVKIINPKDAPLKKKILGIFKSDKTYSCVAVNCDVNLRFDFDVPIKLSAQIEHFTLHCSVNYRVADPEPMARMYESDPILRMQKEIRHKLQHNIQKIHLTIDQVFNDFYGHKKRILSPDIFESLYRFFGDFGAILGGLDMTYTIPEKYLVPLRKEEEFRLKEKTEPIDQKEHIKELQKEQRTKRDQQSLDRIDWEHEEEKIQHKHRVQELENTRDVDNTHHQEEMADVRSMHQTWRDFHKLSTRAVGNAVDSIDGASSLEQVSGAVLSVADKMNETFGGKGMLDSSYKTGTGGSGKELAAGEIDGNNNDLFKGARKLLAQLTQKVAEASMKDNEKDEILACITHIDAEILRKNKADIPVIESYTGQLRERLLKRKELFNLLIFAEIDDFENTLKDYLKRAAHSPPPRTEDTNTT
ncbi:MAG: hypothetical protein GY757_49875, partial [bacterium]|nr:hypothetical protein [bacterium]